MPADTKLGLYLDPGKLISHAGRVWDPGLFGGWVPHQMVGYLWPTGPWYWVCDRLGLPDWIAHRLWIGTLLFAAGSGVWWLARQLGVVAGAAVVAGVVYQCSAYVLPYVSRTSALLLPWAALGWITGWSGRAAVTRRWREPAVVGLLVFTVGAVNATALIMVIPAPLLLVVWLARELVVQWAAALAAMARIAAICTAVSLWWAVMVVVQGRYGADVLAFSETLRDVSNTATSTEVWRGLGYWLFYVRTGSASATTASAPYLTSPWLIGAGVLVTLIGLTGLAVIRWRYRGYAALLAATGVIVAVGAHPLEHRPPLWRAVGSGGLDLAIRSSTRAVPVMVLGVALGIGAVLGARWPAQGRWNRWWFRPGAAAVTAAIAVAALPALWRGQLVDPALRRDEHVPAAWTDAAAALHQAGSRGVLQLPGQEFGAFDWGYTVDPPVASLTDVPLLTRDLLPLGTPRVMDLLFAFDDRFQNGVAEPASVAPIGRLLGADTIWLTADIDAHRFGTATAPEVRAVLDRAGAVGPPRWFADRVALYPVAGSVAADRASRAVVVAGSADGVIDAAAAGLLDGHEAVYYAADRTDRGWADQGLSMVVLTDSNRDRAHHWRGSQQVSGYTQGPGLAPLTDDQADVRLDLFPDQQSTDQSVTVATWAGQPVEAAATTYGSAVVYQPEHRPLAAFDGDATTAWVVGPGTNPIGQQVRTTAPITTVVQPAGATQWISAIRLTDADHPDGVVVPLDERSHHSPGQPVGPTRGPATITILAVAPPIADQPAGDASAGTQVGVGFAELGPVIDEVVRLPELDADLTTQPLAVVLTRLRATRAGQADPERSIQRTWTQPARSMTVSVTLRGTALGGPLAPGCRTIGELDGRPLEVGLGTAEVAALAAGGTVVVGPCDGRAVAMTSGVHRLSAAVTSDGVTIDRVVLAEPAAPAGDAVAFARWQRPVGPPAGVQRLATAALVVSFAAAVALAATVIATRRRATNSASLAATAAWRTADTARDRRRAWISAVALVASAWLVGGTGVAIGAAVVAAAVVITGRTSRLTLLAAALVAANGARLAVLVMRHHPPATSAWPRLFDGLHRTGVLAAVVLAVAALSDRGESPGAAGDPGRPPPSR